MQVLEHRSVLLGAGGGGRPDAFAPAAAARAACALGHVAVLDHEAYGLLGQVVRGRDARRGDEAEVGRPVSAEAVRQVPGLDPRRGALAHLQHPVAGAFQGPLEPRRRHQLPPVDDVKQAPQFFQQPPAVVGGHLVRQVGQELHVADQVGQAELHQHVEVAHVLAVGREVVAAEHAGKLPAQGVNQHLGAARRVDAKEGVEFGPEDPGPQSVAVFLVSRLVDVQVRLLGQPVRQGLVGRPQGDARLADHLGQLPPREAEPQHVAAEAGGGREGAVADALEPAHQGRQPRTDQASLFDLRRQRGVVYLSAMRAPGGVSAVLGDHEGRLRKFHLLERARRALQRSQTSAAVGAAVRTVVEGLVDLVRSEGRSLVTRVSRLAAEVTLAAVLGRRLGWLDDVAGRGLGTVGGVLREAGHLGRQLLHLLLQLGDAGLLLLDDPLVVLFGAGIHGSFGRQASDTLIIGPTAATNPVLSDFDLHLPGGGYTLLIRLTGSLFGHKAVNGYRDPRRSVSAFGPQLWFNEGLAAWLNDGCP